MAVQRAFQRLGIARACAADSCCLALHRPRVRGCRQREQLATPLDPVEHRALLEQCAAAMRPTWTLDMGAFARVGCCCLYGAGLSLTLRNA